jgi:hypothetical protein
VPVLVLCERQCGDFVLEGYMEKMDKKLQLRIGKKLRKIASDIAAEPIPPRFAHLVGPDDPPPFGGAVGARPVEKRKGPTFYRSTEPKVMRSTRGS